MTSRSFAIIGAGMAGLACAHRLTAAGHRVRLFDKSRGVGGRMATRRVEGFVFDHGAQFFRARGEAMGVAVRSWVAAGEAAPWFDDAHVGLPGMTAPARSLAQGLALVTEATVTKLVRHGGGWQVEGRDGPLHAPEQIFDGIVLAVPSPQALPLATGAGLVFPGLDGAVYAPCWALMLGFDRPQPLPADRIAPNDEAIAWIARNGSKPGRPAAEAIVVHAGPAWSRANLERDPQDVAPDLLARFLAVTGATDDPAYMAAHRWRYALVETTAPQPFYWDAAMGAGACGDWGVGPRVEAAFASGHGLAEAVIAA